MKSTVSVIVAALAVCAHSVGAQNVISHEDNNSLSYWQLNRKVGDILKIPHYFTVPYASFAPLPEAVRQSRTSADKSVPIVFPYREARRLRPSNEPKHDLGLRMLLVRSDENRKETSRRLAESGMFETGDIVLSFRPEWYGTLKYSHIQLGISHAGIFYFEKGPDNKRYLKNLDMPLDTQHVGEGYLNSKHYQETPYLHVVRAKNLTEKQKGNLNSWLQLLAKIGPKAYTESKIRFNTDYTAPKYRENSPMKFVGDLGRIALQIPNTAMLTNYCSEFAWSVLSLRDCDPRDPNVVADFKKNDQPQCIQKIFQPMDMAGSITAANDLRDPNLTVGLIDGIPLLMQHRLTEITDKKLRNERLKRLTREGVFNSASDNPKKISSGHIAAEEALLKAAPNLYEALLYYFNLLTDVLTDDLTDDMKSKDTQEQIQDLRNNFNQSLPNYSPTAFMVHALLPQEAAIKRFDYIATIVYAPKIKSKDSYDLFRNLK